MVEAVRLEKIEKLKIQEKFDREEEHSCADSINTKCWIVKLNQEF